MVYFMEKVLFTFGYSSIASILFIHSHIGRFTWINGVVYDGDFVYGKFTGQGTYTWPDNSTYTGLYSLSTHSLMDY